MNTQHSLLIRALNNEHTSRPPVWMMRQAGRYLPEYMELRKKYEFLDRCYTPEIATEITLQPLRRFDFDAGIIFSDILLPLHKMGADLHFRPGIGPQIDNPVRSPSDIAALKEIDPHRDLGPVLEAISLTVSKSDVPILGFAGAPFTLACYLIEGGGSRDWIETKRLMFRHPESFKELLNKLADAVGKHLNAQIEAGAAAVQLFDTWAGALGSDDFLEFALPAAKRALSYVTQAPTLYFTRDSGPFLPYLNSVGSTAIALDWRLDIERARATIGDKPVQGNLDPIALQAPEELLRAKVRNILQKAGSKGYIFNLGHGCVPSTPIEGVATVIDEIRSWGARTQP
ncbi:MAG: uroporphyrinogen decarboxylase [Proteobacteria bacterium]|nr:uroporphyrinogen decarboxylase [Pseudomonadota bacterium]